MAELDQPIIIKKITIEEGGHHGGAWKVAYADFVTAMMAFFLLLWLLSSASDAQLEGIAEFFTPTIGIKDQAGIGFKGGTSPTDIGDRKDDKTPPGIVMGTMPQGPIPEDPQKEALIESTEDANLFEKAEEAIKKAFESDPNLREIRDNIIVEQTPEGLKIEIMDSDKESMFKPGSDVLTEFGRTMLEKMNVVIEKMPNHISITGHTDAVPFSQGARMSNWELSTMRANSARRFLMSKGMTGERVGKIQGRADRELLFPNEPKSSKNRRITIILLRGSHMIIPIGQQPATRSLLSVPRVDSIIEEEVKKEGGNGANIDYKDLRTHDDEPMLNNEPEAIDNLDAAPVDAISGERDGALENNQQLQDAVQKASEPAQAPASSGGDATSEDTLE